MKFTLIPILTSLALSSGFISSSQAEQEDTSWKKAIPGILDGRFRLRFEDVEADNNNPANALTLQSIVNWTSPASASTTLAVTVLDVTHLSTEDFSDGRVNKGTTWINDPDGTEIQEFKINFRGIPRTILTVGRQSILLDNQRVFGGGLFRQNNQTHDAISVHYHLNSQVKIFAAIGNETQRTRAFSEDVEMAVLNLNYSPTADRHFSFYGYQSDSQDNPINSVTSGGLLYREAKRFEHFSLNWALEYGHQTDAHNHPTDFSTDFWQGEIQLAVSRFRLSASMDNQGADNNIGYRFPFGTQHAYRGFTDLFGNTPVNGLEDRQVRIGYVLDFGTITLIRHDFDAESDNQSFGREHAVVANFNLSESWSMMLKWADFEDQGLGNGDVRKYWLHLQYKW